ncbi:MAG: DNA mismatch repair protein MutS [Polyangiaceae bacterium]
MAKERDASETPLMRQYLTAKRGHPDALLFFRLGDFYELFYEDAVVAAKALDLTLTSRNKNAEDSVPMCGVPHHAAASYVQRLTDMGHRVALCEQMADPQTVKGIVPREVVRVLTPALVFDDAGLTPGQNAYVAALESSGAAYGLAAYDGSTGELSSCELPDARAALSELLRQDPRELLVGPGCEAVASELSLARPKLAQRRVPSAMSPVERDAVLTRLLGAEEAERSEPSLVARTAAARVLAYAESCEPGKKLPVSHLVSKATGGTLVLDASTQEHLELVRTNDGGTSGALLAQLDETCTSMGARLLRARLLAPSTVVETIRARLDEVAFFVENPGLRADLRARLGRVADLERLAVKLLTGRVLPRDLVRLRATLTELPGIALEIEKSARALEALGAKAPEALSVAPCEESLELLTRALADTPGAKAGDGDVLRDGYDAELDEARKLARGGQELLVGLEAKLREETQIGSLKLKFTRVFGWYIELTKTHVARAPASWRRKQTVATGERYTNDELDALSDKVAHAEDRLASRETELYVELVRALASHAEVLRERARTIAALDVAQALAEVAHTHDYVRPVVDESLVLSLVDARHPVVERVTAAGTFVPNDCRLDATEGADGEGRARLWLVSGPNMAGKSTFMRQVALAVVLAQMGSFVPAREAHVGVVDRVLTRVGASDNLSKGESTFMVEMKETANVLYRATRRSLVVLDEIGRGTSTYDGLSIAWAVAEHLADVSRCRALFATHYHELTALGESQGGCANYSVSAREHEGDIVFFHKVGPGAASRSYGVACAKLAGLPELVLSRARAILEGLESRGESPEPVRAQEPGPRKKGRARAEAPQLGLFGKEPEGMPKEVRAVVDRLRATDPNALTPMDALVLLAQLKRELGA